MTKVLLVFLDHKVKKEFVVRLVHKVNVVPQANLVQQVLLVHKEFKVLKVPLELLVL